MPNSSSSPKLAGAPAETLPRAGTGSAIFSLTFGLFLGLALLKFGNPPIFEQWVTVPHNFYEFLLGFPWPLSWAYTLTILVVGVGAFNVRQMRNAPLWLVLTPIAWFIWQFLATIGSQNTQLSEATLKHFAVCVVCFYLGLYCLSAVRQIWLFWLGIIWCFFCVLASGFEQHFGGLEETRRYFFLYIYPTMREISPEYLKKMSSTRIFATLFYPNALAGVLLLMLPAVTAVLSRTRKFTTGARVFLAGVTGLAALACLFWSGSKGGWLVMLLLAVMALWRTQMGNRYKYAMLIGLIVLSLTGFGLKYAGFFRKGATSVTARFDYWRAAALTAKTSPWFGTGPGTFAIPYAKIKRPESEMSRLVHNDYLEQASDSGILGFVVYTVMIGGFLLKSYPPRSGQGDWTNFAVWLGLLGFSLQGLMEFGLYIPALAWTSFALFGYLLGQTARQNPSTNQGRVDTVPAK